MKNSQFLCFNDWKKQLIEYKSKIHWIDKNEYSYQNFHGGQWLDYSGGLIFGYWFNKNLGIFIEGKYNKYWNREWHNFSFGANYKIF